MLQFNTPIWEVRGHTLASEQGKPAVEWTEYTTHYEGDSVYEAAHTLWLEITDMEREEPYVLFIYHFGNLYKRVDVC